MNDSGCAWSARSYVRYLSPHVTRPLPVVRETGSFPSWCRRSALLKRTSSQDESSVAVPDTVPLILGKNLFRYWSVRRSSVATSTSKSWNAVKAGKRMSSSPLPRASVTAPGTCASSKIAADCSILK